jgi:hypothetical protein
MFKRIDESHVLASLIARISDFIAKRRGLPVVVGIILVFISLILQLVDFSTGTSVVRLIAIITQSLGILIALIGLLLSDPLGK